MIWKRLFPLAAAVLLVVIAIKLTLGPPREGPPTAQQTAAARQAGTYTVVMETNKGKVTLVLDGKAAPMTTANFVNLVQRRFYDGLAFHRVEPGYLVQGGDPNGDGSGGPGYRIRDEASPLKHLRGAVAMAKTVAENSGGSQFYLCLLPIPQLDGKFTVFGKVSKGLDVVESLEPNDAIIKMRLGQDSKR